MGIEEAGIKTAVLMLISGVGTILCGHLVDRLGSTARRNNMRIPAVYALLSCGLLIAAFSAPPGATQLALLAAGLFVAGGVAGPAAAVITGITRPAILATALGMMALFGGLPGQAPGAFITGILADSFGLQSALQVAPLVCLLSAAAFAWGARSYERELHHEAATAAVEVGARA